jgi:hypothetical protein
VSGCVITLLVGGYYDIRLLTPTSVGAIKSAWAFSGSLFITRLSQVLTFFCCVRIKDSPFGPVWYYLLPSTVT